MPLCLIVTLCLTTSIIGTLRSTLGISGFLASERLLTTRCVWETAAIYVARNLLSSLLLGLYLTSSLMSGIDTAAVNAEDTRVRTQGLFGLGGRGDSLRRRGISASSSVAIELKYRQCFQSVQL